MTLPRLTLTWDDGADGVRIYYDPNSNTWSSDYEEPAVSDAYIALMQMMTDGAFLRKAYTPYPLLDRIEALAADLNFTLDGIDDLYDELGALVDKLIKDGAAF